MTIPKRVLLVAHRKVRAQARTWLNREFGGQAIIVEWGQLPVDAVYEFLSPQYTTNFIQRLNIWRAKVPHYVVDLSSNVRSQVSAKRQLIRLATALFIPGPLRRRLGLDGLLKLLAQFLVVILNPFYSPRKRYLTKLILAGKEGKRPPFDPLPTHNHFKMLHLHSDPWYEAVPGGTLAHVRGVLTGSQHLGVQPHLLTHSGPPEMAWTPVRVNRRVPLIPEVDELRFMAKMRAMAREIIQKERPAVLYQRHFRHSIIGVELAKEFNLPLILENNGSIVWSDTAWTGGFYFKELVDLAERASLFNATLVVCISQEVANSVSALGVPAEKIFVNPNGVDEQRFNPTISGAAVREELGLQNKKVIGFLGTFGPWHGAEVLAQAVGPVVKRIPDAHFLFIGDGAQRLSTQDIVHTSGMANHTTFTGRIPTEQAPEYLAACDILTSPHVHNHDGSAFFGSPTKLFEYMAMGKPIVASGISQLAEILEHGKTAWLVPPGDPAALADGIVCLINDPTLCQRLGAETRAEVVEKYTWQGNMQRNFEKLRELQSAAKS